MFTGNSKRSFTLLFFFCLSNKTLIGFGVASKAGIETSVGSFCGADTFNGSVSVDVEFTNSPAISSSNS